MIFYVSCVAQHHHHAQSLGFTLVCSGYCDADRQLSPVFLEAVDVCVCVCECVCARVYEAEAGHRASLVADLRGQVPLHPSVGAHTLTK